MVIDISGLLGLGKKKTARRPLLNQIPISSNVETTVPLTSILNNKRRFWKWFRENPELNSPVSIRVDDTITEVTFTKPDGQPLGRNKRLDAIDFWNENMLYERLKSFQFDRLTTGSGFLWIGGLSKKQRREVCERVVKNFYFRGVDTRTYVDNLLSLRSFDEDLRKPRKVDYVASSTMIINHDLHDIKNYIQWFSARQVIFKPEEIIHIPLHRVDGKVDGFTPIWSLTREMLLLWAIKENMISYFRNGGSPSKAWILPNELADSDNHKWLVQELMNRGAVQNRHGNLVLTGEIKIEDLEPMAKDMDYKDLALYVTSNIAYALRVPVTRIPFLIGQSATKSDAGGMAESGYWSMVGSDQLTLESGLNSQLFNKLGFAIKFKRQYKIDDLREAQSANFRIDAITKIRNELKSVGLKLKKEKLVKMVAGSDFEVSLSDVEEMSEEEMMTPFEKTGLLNKTFMKDKEVLPNPDKQQINETKRNSALDNPKGNKGV